MIMNFVENDNKLATKVMFGQTLTEASNEEKISKLEVKFNKLREKAEVLRDRQFKLEDELEKIVKAADKLGAEELSGVHLDGLSLSDLMS